MVRRWFYVISVLLLAAIGVAATAWPAVLWSLVLIGPTIALGMYDALQRTHTITRNFPLVGRGRYLFEMVRPEIQQYFVENDIDGTPFSREYRSVVYQRAKGELQTQPFGTQHDLSRVGTETIAHSLAPVPAMRAEPLLNVGGPNCAQPYEASRLNVSAMSFGSLSRNAIRALNRGAKIGRFAHNTGEGGISPHHLQGGDLTWQIGTGYFGCRTANGDFDSELFRENAQRSEVKLIEIKLSQGAKPGHGGILPGDKVTAEIARIRGVEIGKTVISPPAHRAFSTPIGLLEFVAKLRELSGGKPIGFKLCIGLRRDFFAICKAMVATDIAPDFITVDGAEGGTGAAPVEFANSVGLPMQEGLSFVHGALLGVSRRTQIALIASGKIVTGFHMFRAMALGADACNSARAMMFALGCIQALRCNTNACPTGVATQDPALTHGLHVGDKSQRVATFHRDTIHAFLELLGATGLHDPREIRPFHIRRRVDALRTMHLGEIYKCMGDGDLLERRVPPSYRETWEAADPEHFVPTASDKTIVRTLSK